MSTNVIVDMCGIMLGLDGTLGVGDGATCVRHGFVHWMWHESSLKSLLA
jgi:hypothetical protein